MRQCWSSCDIVALTLGPLTLGYTDFRVYIAVPGFEGGEVQRQQQGGEMLHIASHLNYVTLEFYELRRWNSSAMWWIRSQIPIVKLDYNVVKMDHNGKLDHNVVKLGLKVNACYRSFSSFVHSLRRVVDVDAVRMRMCGLVTKKRPACKPFVNWFRFRPCFGDMGFFHPIPCC